jgi:hypothetical protein
MKHLNIHSYCVANSGKQPVPAYWLSTQALSSESTFNMSMNNINSIRGTADLGSEGWDG